MYKPLQKKNSSWIPSTAQKKSKSPSKLGHFSIQPKPNQKSSQSPEIGKYSRDSADTLAANVMRSLEAKSSQETETPTVQPQSESRGISVADVVGSTIPTLTPHTLTPLQRKLTVGQPGDKYEQEADAVAAKVVEQINSPTSQQPVQGKVEPVAQPTVMRDGGVGGGAIDASIEQSIQQAKGGGQGLSEDVREPMEQAFGADFSGVRVHNNSNADQLNRSLNARAFTTGPDIFFKQGEYNPGSRDGQELLAHELTHVVQQTPNLTDDIQQKLGAGNQIQRATGDGHDLSSPRFAKDTTLEDIYDGNGTLKQGDEGDAVRKIQHGIHDAGILFLGHGVDGKFGSETEQRVNSFQRQNKITSDPKGEVGAATIEKLDQLFPAIALPTSATDPSTFAGMLELLCQWNSAMIRDLRTLQVQMVGALEWADEEFDGSNWVPNPMLGAGETFGGSIIIATNATNEEVARTLYHIKKLIRTTLNSPR
ncbi:eCIS core domain-containing protein [Coleofasciculus sp. E1-EBD-02]|uniref:eCIS core domain-containing protein n=1 Tax=Coleofasciculus sp. E1-EBD-02 TaxID=3068481 RepID=UPI0032FF04E3